MEQVKIEYFGHSCFKLTWKGVSLVLDPYEDGCVPGNPNLRLSADFVFCSHSHGDHNAVKNVKLTKGAPMDFRVTEIETDHDAAGGSKRGKNMIRIFDFNGIRIAHFGDLGRKLSAEEAEKLCGLDCILIPIGGFYTIDGATAAAIAEDLKPRMVIPMHYRTDNSGFEVLADIDDVLPLFDDSVNIVTLTYGGYAVLEK